MSGTDKRFWARVLPVAGAVAALIAVGGASYAHVADDRDEARCTITTSTQAGLVMVEGLYHAEKAGSGSYTFEVNTVSGPNNTQIRQGGGFSAQADELVSLGHSTLGSPGSVYDISLTIDFAGKTVTCTGRVGDRVI